MSLIFLTQDQGMFFGPIAKVLGWILEQLANFLYMFDGYMNVGVTIVLFTFLINTLMLPLNIKQYKFQKLQSSIAPELSRIQKKYKGKKDEVSLRKQQAETSALYQKYGTSPTSGCLPMLLTLPILFALYRVIYHIPGYVEIYYNQYAPLAKELLKVPNIGELMTQFQAGNAVSLTSPLQIPFDQWGNYSFANETAANCTVIQNNMVEFLSQFKTQNWENFSNFFRGYDGLPTLIEQTKEAAIHMNTFLGMNIAEHPSFTHYSILIPVASAGFQYLQTRMMPTTNTDPDNPMGSTMQTMNIVMPIMSGVFCFILPIGIGIYWVAGSVYRIIQQLFVNAYMKKIDVDELVKKNVEKQNKKRARAGLEPLKIEDVSKQRYSTIETVEEKTKVNKKKSEASDYKRIDKPVNSGSIADMANLLAKKNGEKGEK